MRLSCLTVISLSACSQARCATSPTPQGRKPTVKAHGCSLTFPRCCFTGAGWPRSIHAWSPGTRRGSRGRRRRRCDFHIAARQISRCPGEYAACCRNGQDADAGEVPGVQIDRSDDREQDRRRSHLLALPRVWRGLERRSPPGAVPVAAAPMVTIRRDAARAPACRIELTPEGPPGYNCNRPGRTIEVSAGRAVSGSGTPEFCREPRQ